MQHVIQNATIANVMLCLVLSSGYLQETQKEAPADARITTLLGQFHNANWEERAAAFYHLLDSKAAGGLRGRTVLIPSVLQSLLNSYPRRADEIKLSLIGLLANENSVVQAQQENYRKTGKTLTEEHVNYYGDLIAVVSSLQDERSLQALLGAIDTGNIVTRALAGFGRAALNPVIARLEDRSEITRNACMRIISQMLDPGNTEKVSDPTSKEKIKHALIKGSRDESPFVRISAIEGLAKLRDADVIPLLEKLAREDPYQASTHRAQRRVYPVREAARKALGLQN